MTLSTTAAKEVTSVSVKTPPAKLTYTAGEALNLSGIAATLTYNDGSTEDVALSDFASNGLVASPANGVLVSGKWFQIDGKWHYFYADGTLAKNVKINGYEVDGNGVGKTKQAQILIKAQPDRSFSCPAVLSVPVCH